MNEDRDDLVGLNFELGGGFGTASGTIIGRAGRDHYIVQRSGDSHFELCAISDLLAAKFYPGKTPPKPASNGNLKPRLQDRIKQA